MSFAVESRRERRIVPFNVNGFDYTIRLNPFPDNLPFHEAVDRLYRTLDDLILFLLSDPLTGNPYPDTDRVRMSIRSPLLDMEIWLPFMSPAEMTTDRFFHEVQRVVQSKRAWLFEETMLVNFIHAPLPVGGVLTGRFDDALQ